MFERSRRHGLAFLCGLLLPAPALAGTFDDGLFEAESVAPLAGWFVPPRVMRESYAIPPADVIAASRAMTASELAEHFSGGERQSVSEDFPLFAFPNQGTNVFLWMGRRDGEQQILPRAWDGALWSHGPSGDGRADAAEMVFPGPRGAGVVHVLVMQQGGQSGRQAIRTERVLFARFPGRQAILDRGLARADTVVWIPPDSSPARWPRHLDCLKGRIDAETLRTLPGAERLRNSSLVFLSGADAARRIDFWFDGETGVFTGRHGPLADPEFDPTGPENRQLRWRLARRSAGAAEPATLSIAEGGDGWISLELAVGRDAPGELYAAPITRSGRDGGAPLFRFEFRHGEIIGEVTTRGRFGADSFDAAEPEPYDSIGLDCRFVRCGPGVVKLEIRPRTRPWRGKVRAIVTPRSRLGERSEERVATSPLPIAAD